jgi:hypothetical protein
MMDAPKPEMASTDPFRALAASLEASDHAGHGERIERVLDGTWTTSSELLGELGAAVDAVRKECTPLTTEQKRLVDQCLKEVRKAWPGFGRFDWWPFRWW